MTEYHMPVRDAHVIVGVSGGADSMCLLFVLQALKDRFHMTLIAVHINHGLRGDAADADQMFVEDFCRQQGIECVTYKTDVRKLADERKLSEEEAGRWFRYECFRKVMKEKAGGCIAVAHHRDDQAETMLFNLVRGSGLAGLSGMTPVKHDIIRPLLCLSRRQIEAVLEEAHIDFRTDATNFENIYTRNKIRRELLPYIEEHINAGASEHIASAAQSIREAYEYIQTQAREGFKQCRTEDGGLDCGQLLKFSPVLQKEMLRLWLESAVGGLKDVTSTHILAVLDLVEGPEGRRICLPRSTVIIKRNGCLGAIKTNSCEKINSDVKIKETDLPAMEVTEFPYSIDLKDGRMLTFEIKPCKENERIPQKNCTKWFDYDKIMDGLVVRHRQNGDVMSIGSGRMKKLRRIMIDDKVPADQRDRLWLIASGSHVLWPVGSGRISEAFKIDDATGNILIVQIAET